MKKFKAIKIDIEKQEVYEVDIDNYKDISKHIDCRCFTIACYINKKEDCIFVDDEGLLTPIQGAFEYEGAPQPYAGHGLVIGTTKSGNSKTPTVTVEEIKKAVTFLTPWELRKKYATDTSLEVA